MSDTDSLSGISFYLDDSIFALASPATHARSTLSTTVSSNLSLSLSLPLSSPYLLSILPSSSYPASFILPSGLSFTRIQPLLPSSFVHPFTISSSTALSLSLARSFLSPRLSRAHRPSPPLHSPRVSLYLLHALISRSLSTKYAIYPRASHHRTRSRHD